jgi:hypothetical protein
MTTIRLVFPGSVRTVRVSGTDSEVRAKAAKLAESCAALSYSLTR